jgi:hypothetical protein
VFHAAPAVRGTAATRLESASLMGTGRHDQGLAAVHLRSGYQPRPGSPGRGFVKAHRERHASHRKASRAARAVLTVSCSGSGGLLPANYQEIVSFLVAHGYSGNAAAGIAGNIFQESGGNPESVGMGGGGLIGWTPLPPGLVTGDPATDLRSQLQAILSFNQLWAQYVPALNSAATPAQAAGIYVTYFERAGIPAAGNREASAAAVAAACGL